jgi:hypothetical protein
MECKEKEEKGVHTVESCSGPIGGQRGGNGPAARIVAKRRGGEKPRGDIGQKTVVSEKRSDIVRRLPR